MLRPGSGGNGGTVATAGSMPDSSLGDARRRDADRDHDTEKGTIVIKLEADLSPIAVGNFAALVDCGFYDGVVFHRTAALDAARRS